MGQYKSTKHGDGRASPDSKEEEKLVSVTPCPLHSTQLWGGEQTIQIKIWLSSLCSHETKASFARGDGEAGG